MAKLVNVNYTDTPIPDVTTLTLNRGLVNYGADFKVRKDEPGEVILTNLTSPVNYPEKFRFGMSEVSDIYKGTGIDPGLYSPSRRGVSILAQVTDTWTVTDPADAAYTVALPVSCHIVLKVPMNENITPAMVQALLGRCVSGIYETGSNNTTRLQAMLRGALKPSDI